MTKLEHLSKFESEFCTNRDDLVQDYVDDDWADEFDDIFEAYEETGRGQAESQAVQELIKREYPDIDDDEFVKLMDQLAILWCISYN